jgi:hypothetical protein
VSETVTTSISWEGRSGLPPPDLARPIPPDPPVPKASKSSKTPAADTKPRLVWTKPIVRELFGEERRERLEEIEPQDLDMGRIACARQAGVLQ